MATHADRTESVRRHSFLMKETSVRSDCPPQLCPLGIVTLVETAKKLTTQFVYLPEREARRVVQHLQEVRETVSHSKFH